MDNDMSMTDAVKQFSHINLSIHKMQHNRKIYLDFEAAIMLLYMMYTHICQLFKLPNDTISIVLHYAFFMFMPWFFFKGGMCFKIRGFNDVLKRGIVRLIKPYVIWSIIGTMVLLVCNYLAFGELYILKEGKDFISWIVNKGSCKGNLALWFLPSLFVARLITEIAKGRKVVCLSIIVFFFLLALCLNFYHISRPMWCANILTGSAFFLSGYMLKEIQSNKKIILLCLVVSISIYNMCFSYVDIRSNSLIEGHYLVWTIFSICLIIIHNNIYKKIFEIDGVRKNRIVLLVCNIGKHSLILYVTHWPLLLLLRECLNV